MSATVVTALDVVGGKYQIVATWLYSDPYEITGPPDLAHRGFQVQWSTSADMSSPTTTHTQGTYLVINANIGETLYVRVRGFSGGTQFGSGSTFGEWSSIESATETTSGDDPWDANDWLSFTAVAIVQSGAVAISAASARYKRNGNVVFFVIEDAQISPSSPAPSGYIRIGGIPVQLRDGGAVAAEGHYLPAASPPKKVAAKVVDSGDGTVAIEVCRYDGVSVSSASGRFWLAGFYEAEPA